MHLGVRKVHLGVRKVGARVSELRDALSDALSPIIDPAIAARVTPGAVVCVSLAGATSVTLAFGHLDYESQAVVGPHTVYDLASLTKVFTALCALRLASRGELSLDAPLGEVLPLARGTAFAARPLTALLSHRAGFEAWRPLYLGPREEILPGALDGPSRDDGVEVYSDLGYIALGAALEHATSTALPALIDREVLAPLGLSGRVEYRSTGEADLAVAPTERCPWRGRVLRGEVHDENAWAMGGVAGHAGLFGDAEAVTAVGRAALDALAGDDRWITPDAMRATLAPIPLGTHRLGWDGRSPGASSSGRYFSDASFGHLGFTGTSLWCDPERGLAVTLLTNRVHPSREGAGIKSLRPAVHDAVTRAIFS